MFFYFYNKNSKIANKLLISQKEYSELLQNNPYKDRLDVYKIENVNLRYKINNFQVSEDDRKLIDSQNDINTKKSIVAMRLLEDDKEVLISQISNLNRKIEIKKKIRIEYEKQEKLNKEKENDGKKRFGSAFELLVARYYENLGYSVEHRGKNLGKKDGGIDVIAMNSRELILIQCKYWKREQSISHSMIKEFYGNCAFYLDSVNKNIYKYKTVSCLYAIKDLNCLDVSAKILFKQNYKKCRFKVFDTNEIESFIDYKNT
jgi:restriction system protein